MTRQHALTVTRTFRATPRQLYAAWTDLELMRRWMGTTVQADVRVGGLYRRTVDAGDDGLFTHVGRYELLEPDRRVVQSFALEGAGDNPFVDEQIEVQFRPLGPETTELVLTDRWNGPPMSADENAAADRAWGDWLLGIQAALPPDAVAADGG